MLTKEEQLELEKMLKGLDELDDKNKEKEPLNEKTVYNPPSDAQEEAQTKETQSLDDILSEMADEVTNPSEQQKENAKKIMQDVVDTAYADNEFIDNKELEELQEMADKELEEPMQAPNLGEKIEINEEELEKELKDLNQEIDEENIDQKDIDKLIDDLGFKSYDEEKDWAELDAKQQEAQEKVEEQQQQTQNVEQKAKQQESAPILAPDNAPERYKVVVRTIGELETKLPQEIRKSLSADVINGYSRAIEIQKEYLSIINSEIEKEPQKEGVWDKLQKAQTKATALLQKFETTLEATYKGLGTNQADIEANQAVAKKKLEGLKGKDASIESLAKAISREINGCIRNKVALDNFESISKTIDKNINKLKKLVEENKDNKFNAEDKNYDQIIKAMTSLSQISAQIGEESTKHLFEGVNLEDKINKIITERSIRIEDTMNLVHKIGNLDKNETPALNDKEKMDALENSILVKGFNENNNISKEVFEEYNKKGILINNKPIAQVAVERDMKIGDIPAAKYLHENGQNIKISVINDDKKVTLQQDPFEYAFNTGKVVDGKNALEYAVNNKVRFEGNKETGALEYFIRNIATHEQATKFNEKIPKTEIFDIKSGSNRGKTTFSKYLDHKIKTTDESIGEVGFNIFKNLKKLEQEQPKEQAKAADAPIKEKAESQNMDKAKSEVDELNLKEVKSEKNEQKVVTELPYQSMKSKLIDEEVKRKEESKIIEVPLFTPVRSADLESQEKQVKDEVKSEKSEQEEKTTEKYSPKELKEQKEKSEEKTTEKYSPKELKKQKEKSEEKTTEKYSPKELKDIIKTENKEEQVTNKSNTMEKSKDDTKATREEASKHKDNAVDARNSAIKSAGATALLAALSVVFPPAILFAIAAAAYTFIKGAQAITENSKANRIESSSNTNVSSEPAIKNEKPVERTKDRIVNKEADVEQRLFTPFKSADLKAAKVEKPEAPEAQTRIPAEYQNKPVPKPPVKEALPEVPKPPIKEANLEQAMKEVSKASVSFLGTKVWDKVEDDKFKGTDIAKNKQDKERSK